MVDQEAVYAYLHEVGRHYAIKHPAWVNEVEDWASLAYLKVVKCFPLNNRGWKTCCQMAFDSVRCDYWVKTGRHETIRDVSFSVPGTEDYTGDATLQIWEAIKCLPESYQQVWLCDILGFELKDGAKHLGISIAAYKGRLYRSREKVKKILGP